MLETWRQLSQLKTNLIQLADTIILENVMTKEDIALELLSNVEMINGLEQSIIYPMKEKMLQKLYVMSEEKENDHLAANEMTTTNV